MIHAVVFEFTKNNFKPTFPNFKKAFLFLNFNQDGEEIKGSPQGTNNISAIPKPCLFTFEIPRGS